LLIARSRLAGEGLVLGERKEAVVRKARVRRWEEGLLLEDTELEVEVAGWGWERWRSRAAEGEEGEVAEWARGRSDPGQGALVMCYPAWLCHIVKEK
jgi:hypothetical protein